MARRPRREGRRRSHRRRTGECLCPRPSSAGASSAVLDSQLQASLQAAGIDVGRADAIGPRLPDHSFFVYSYVRKRAVLSTHIEGPRSSTTDLLMIEWEGKTGIPRHDVTGARLALPEQPDSEPWVARNAGNSPILR